MKTIKAMAHIPVCQLQAFGTHQRLIAFVSTIALWCLAGCQPSESTTSATQHSLSAKYSVEATHEKLNQQHTQTAVQLAVDKAVAAKDYRLYKLSGRRVVVPGFEAATIDVLAATCGLQFLPQSGDVLRSAEDKTARASRYAFAEQYNQAIYPICLNARK